MKILLIILYVNGASTVVPFEGLTDCRDAVFGLGFEPRYNKEDKYILNGVEVDSVSCKMEMSND